MIVYPIIIILILLVAFFVVWRRAYFVEKEGVVREEPVFQEKPTTAGRSSSRDMESEGEGALNRSKIFSRIKKQEEPEVVFDKPRDPLMEKAEELFFKKQYISAEKWYLEVVKKDPRNPKIYSRLGLIYISQKNYKDAIACLEEANKIGPALASRCFNLSFAYNEEGSRREALEHARKAMKLEPSNSKYRNWFNELRSRPF